MTTTTWQTSSTLPRVEQITADLAAGLRARRWTPRTWPSQRHLRQHYLASRECVQEVVRRLAAAGLLWTVERRWQPVPMRAEMDQLPVIARDLVHRLSEWRWIGLDNAWHTRPVPSVTQLAAQYQAATRTTVCKALQQLVDRGHLQVIGWQVIALPQLPHQRRHR